MPEPLAADPVIGQHLTDSRDDAVVVGKTVGGGDVVFLHGPHPRIAIRDQRGRTIASISNLTTLDNLHDELTAALDG